MVAVKNRAMAALNPVAQYRAPITIDDVKASRRVAYPLNLLDCCPTGDGGAAAVILSEDARSRLADPRRTVKIAASVLRTGLYEQIKDITTFELDVRSCAIAYEQAGLGPREVNVAEVHDAFTITELIHCEDLGFVSGAWPARR